MKDNKFGEYKPFDCIICCEEWESSMDWSDGYICPLCDMGVIDMIKEVYPVDGMGGVIRMLWFRVINFRKKICLKN